MTKRQKVKVVNNAVPLMVVTFTIFANALVMIRLQDRLYVHMQKGKKNIRIPKLNKIPALCLQHIITSSEITEQEFTKVTAE